MLTRLLFLFSIFYSLTLLGQMPQMLPLVARLITILEQLVLKGVCEQESVFGNNK